MAVQPKEKFLLLLSFKLAVVLNSSRLTSLENWFGTDTNQNNFGQAYDQPPGMVYECREVPNTTFYIRLLDLLLTHAHIMLLYFCQPNNMDETTTRTANA